MSELKRFVCPACGAPLLPESDCHGYITCDYCGSTYQTERENYPVSENMGEGPICGGSGGSSFVTITTSGTAHLPSWGLYVE